MPPHGDELCSGVSPLDASGVLSSIPPSSRVEQVSSGVVGEHRSRDEKENKNLAGKTTSVSSSSSFPPECERMLRLISLSTCNRNLVGIEAWRRVAWGSSSERLERLKREMEGDQSWRFLQCLGLRREGRITEKRHGEEEEEKKTRKAEVGQRVRKAREEENEQGGVYVHGGGGEEEDAGASARKQAREVGDGRVSRGRAEERKEGGEGEEEKRDAGDAGGGSDLKKKAVEVTAEEERRVNRRIREVSGGEGRNAAGPEAERERKSTVASHREKKEQRNISFGGMPRGRCDGETEARERNSISDWRCEWRRRKSLGWMSRPLQMFDYGVLGRDFLQWREDLIEEQKMRIWLEERKKKMACPSR